MNEPGALRAALPLLACPHCVGVGRNDADQHGVDQDGVDAGLVRIDAGSVGCAAGHRFDQARQGYLPLLGGRSRTDTGDDAAMVAARQRFLGAGHYRPIADAVLRSVSDPPDTDPDGRTGALLEIGAGTGYYLAHADPRIGIAVDSSRYAARRSAKVHPRVASVLADAWAPLPIRSQTIDAVLVIFAPRGAAELGRVLRPGGIAVIVTPEPAHLAEIRGPLGMLDIDAGKAASVAEALRPGLQLQDSAGVTAQLTLSHADLRALVGMGPTARHLDADAIATAVAVLPEPTTVTMAVTVSRFRNTAARGAAAT